MRAERIPYDEFGLFHENAAEYGLPYDCPPVVRREFAHVTPGRRISALIWGTEGAQYAFLHGGAQNAHTWDTVAMALDRPLVAVDLPGHGHSDSPTDELSAHTHAADVAAALTQWVPQGVHLVGMSLGGLTSIVVVAEHPELVRSLTLVDITPGVTREKTAAISAFVNGPTSFTGFDDLLARTIEHNPTRSVSSLRRGILHNALQQDDGSWVWRYRRHGAASPIRELDAGTAPPDYTGLWDALGAVRVPVMLARGMTAQSVVTNDDEAELRRRLPDAKVVHFDRAGHSVQGDMPVELAAAIADFTR
jgi:pimeloyl-ACP methyl ester carboxylesterase